MAAATVVKFDVTSNSKNSRKDLEREAVDSFRELERAEKAAGIPELGKRFGKAMADLNENLEHGEWMKTLERLGITYRKAQYWMHIYKGKTPTGSKNRTDNASEQQAAGCGRLRRPAVALGRRSSREEGKEMNELLQRQPPADGRMASGTREGGTHPAGRRR